MRERQETTGRTPAKSVRPRTKSGPARARKGNMGALMVRVEQIRQTQRETGHFDCFARANNGYCDQAECMYRSDCLSTSPKIRF